MARSSLKRVVVAAALSLLFTLTARDASAQYVGTATSGAATADGASAFNNPAAMDAGEEDVMIELDIGAAFLSATIAPADGSAASSASPLGPYLTLGGYTAAIHPDWRVGLTATIPETQGGQWGREDGAGNMTRYFMVDGALFHISVVPAVSWSPVEWLAIGVGANITYGNMRMELDKDMGSALNQAAMSTVTDSPFPYAEPALAAPIDGSADGWGIGVVGGVFVNPPIPESWTLESISFGLSVHSPVYIGAHGSLAVEYPQTLVDFVDGLLPGATLPDLGAEFDLDLSRPLRLGVEISVFIVPQLEIGHNYVFENTSSQPNFNLVITETATPDFIEDTTKPQAYTNRHRMSLRVAYLPIPAVRLVLFGAIQNSVIPDLTMAPNNIDFDRFEIGLAARWHIVPELSVYLQYSHVFLGTRNITDSLHRPLTQTSLTAFNHPSPTGTYSGSADTVRLGLGLHL